MKISDLLKLLVDRETGDLDREQIEIEITARATLNEISPDDFDDCAFG
jgi:hypothetical protein